MFDHWHYAGAEVPANQQELDEYNERIDAESSIHEDLFLSPTQEWRERRNWRMRKVERGPMTPELINEVELCEMSTLCENISECIDILKSKERWSILSGDDSSQDRIDKTKVYINKLTKCLEDYECLTSF
mgnify:CR=1 FL=1